MELKPIRTGSTIVWLGLIVALLVGYEVFVVAWIVTTGDWRGLLGLGLLLGSLFLGILLILNVIFCAAFAGTLRRGQYLRSLATRDPTLVSAATPQPDRSLALSNGETLALTYHRLHSQWRQVPALILVSLLMAISGEALIFVALPVFGQSALNSFNLLNIALLKPPTTVAPTPLDWLAAAFPLLFSLALIVMIIVYTAINRLPALTADDAGITLRKGRRRTAIPWNDIVLFAHTGVSAPSSTVGSYVLWGRTHRLPFSVVGPRVVENLDDSGAQQTRFYFDGGYETYQANVQRLFATITVRAYTPLLLMREASLVRAIRRRAPVMTTTEDDAREFPLADQAWQPRMNDGSATLAFGEQLTLRARFDAWPVMGESLLWLLVVGPIFGFTLNSLGIFNTMQSLGLVGEVIIVAIVIPLVGFLAWAIAVMRRSAFRPTISVDGFGITSHSSGQEKSVTILWQDISLWVVVPSPVRTPTSQFATSSSAMDTRSPGPSQPTRDSPGVAFGVIVGRRIGRWRHASTR